jgi:TolB-like protein/tetratricopeptide (TPR) repeat protein
MFPNSGPRETFRFGGFELDVSAYELRCQTGPVRLERRPMDLLILLVERRGQLVSRSDIVERLWEKDVFFDAEPAVNTVIWKVRGALHDSPDAPTFVETVPGRGYRFIAAVEVIACPHASADSSGLRNQLSQPLDTITIVVLPFHNLSSDAEQEYFSDGLTEETISALGQLNPEHIRVVARTSSMAYKRTSKTAAQIGQELHANYLLESSVRREVRHVRIATQLIRVEDEIQVWSGTYDRTPDGFLGVQDEIGRAIATEILAKLTPIPHGHVQRRSTPDPEAYDLYLRGKYDWHHFAIPKAIECFEAAIGRDASYAPAYAGLAEACAALPILADAVPRDYWEKARLAADKALALDPHLADAHAASGFVDFFLGWDWARAEGSLRRAIELNPNYALAHFYCAHVLSNSYRHDEAIALIRNGREIDPLSPIMHSFHGQFLFDARRYTEALEPIQRAIAIAPNFFHGHEILSRLYLQMGALDEALEECEKSYQLSGGMLFALARKGYVLATAGRRAEAEQVMAQLETMSSARFVAPFHFALVHAGLGHREEAVNCLVQAFDVRAVHLVLFPTDPVWDSFRDERRLRTLLKKYGLPEASARGSLS